jgi:hypothetical protein
MSDYKNRKPNPAASYPADAQSLDPNNQGAAGFTRVEPFLDVDRLKGEYLWGLNLKSPIDGTILPDSVIKNIITKSYAKSELELDIDISPVSKVKRIEYDRTKAMQGGNMLDLGTKNVRKIFELSIRTHQSQTFNNNVPEITPETDNANLDGILLYSYPLTWINMSLSGKGQISLSPLLNIPAAVIPAGNPNAGIMAGFLSVMNQLQYMSGYWYVRYETGFEDGSIPSTINQYVALVSLREIINLILTAQRVASTSLNHDSSGQSVSNAQIQVLGQRLQDLDAELGKLKNLIKSKFTNSVHMTNV